MVKIKVEKKMKLLELIDWAWENGVKGEVFPSSRVGQIKIDHEGNIGSIGWIFESDTFAIEIEEEVTEETKINKLVEVYRNIEDTILFTDLHHDYSISEVKDNEEYAVCSRAFYILNDDFNMTLIWKDGELVGDE